MRRRRNPTREAFLADLSPRQRALWKRLEWIITAMGLMWLTGAIIWVGEPSLTVRWAYYVTGAATVMSLLLCIRALHLSGPPFNRARHWWWPWGTPPP